jgi:hypothetical protein
MFYHEDGFTFIRYNENKRPLKLAVYWIDSPEKDHHLTHMYQFVVSNVNAPVHVQKMPPEKFWALIERISTLYCKMFAPTANYGISKPEIRGAMYFFIKAAADAGDWQEYIRVGKDTFVQEVSYDE